MSPSTPRRDPAVPFAVQVASIGSALQWVARLGSVGAVRNAKEAVEASGRADALLADLSERVQQHGWDDPRAAAS